VDLQVAQEKWKDKYGWNSPMEGNPKKSMKKEVQRTRFPNK
jgi:hypothetical protein